MIKPKICMVVLSYYPFDPRVRREAEALEEAGMDVDIICRKFPGQKKEEKFGKVTAYRIMHAPAQDNITKYIFNSILFQIMAFFKLQKLFLINKYNLIQVHNMPDYLVFTTIVQKLLGVPIVLDLHDLTVDLIEERWPGNAAKILKYFVKLVEKLSANFATHLITVTDSCKSLLVSRGNPENKISVIYNTPDESVFKFNYKRKFEVIEKEASLFYHGTIGPRFGLQYVIESLIHLHKAIPGSTLSIYGIYEGNYKLKLKELVQNLNLEKYVFLNDVINREEVVKLINEHDFGVVPYEDSHYMNIALPTKALEYIAIGIPLVSTRLKEMTEIFDDNSILFFDNLSTKAISGTIIKLCENPELRKKQTIRALNKLTPISGNMVKNIYVNLVKNLIYKT